MSYLKQKLSSSSELGMKSGSVNRTSVVFFLWPVFLKRGVVDVLNFGLLSLTGNEEVKLLVSIFSIFNFWQLVMLTSCFHCRLRISCWTRLNQSQNPECRSSFRCGGMEWLSGDRVCVRLESSLRLWGLFLLAVPLCIDKREGCIYKYIPVNLQNLFLIFFSFKHPSWLE